MGKSNDDFDVDSMIKGLIITLICSVLLSWLFIDYLSGFLIKIFKNVF